MKGITDEKLRELLFRMIAQEMKIYENYMTIRRTDINEDKLLPRFGA